MTWTEQQVESFVRSDMDDVAAECGTSIAIITGPVLEDGCAVFEGITPEGSLVRSRFCLMNEYAVTGWA